MNPIFVVLIIFFSTATSWGAYSSFNACPISGSTIVQYKPLLDFEPESCTRKASGCYAYRSQGAKELECSEKINSIDCWCPGYQEIENQELREMIHLCGALEHFSAPHFTWSRGYNKPATSFTCINEVHRNYQDIDVEHLRYCLTDERAQSDIALTHCLRVNP